MAVYDPHHAQAVADEVGADVAESLDALLARADIQAVVISSPNSEHHDTALRAAAAGKEIFCEKPIALSYGQCAEMVEAARAAGVSFMAGHVMNFMAGVRRAKAIIADGRIGEVLFIRAIRNGWEDAQPEVSWKKRRALSGGHLHHHIHELDLVQSILGPAESAYMVGGNVAHTGEQFCDEDDMLIITLQFPDNRFAALEYGSAFRWSEHYVLIEGSLGSIRIDLQGTGVEVRVGGQTERFLLHRREAEDRERTEIYAGSSTDGAVQYGSPRKRPPMWLRGIIEEELTYFHGLMTGAAPSEEFAALSDGSAATASIATADACTRSRLEGRKVLVSEITQGGGDRRRPLDGPPGVTHSTRDSSAAEHALSAERLVG